MMQKKKQIKLNVHKVTKKKSVRQNKKNLKIRSTLISNNAIFALLLHYD